MPELKHTFTSGRMNKDLDERLVPNGEYRDAQNVEVLTSEGSNVGTVQTCLGNSLISDRAPDGASTCVGGITDDKTNNVYYFIAGHPGWQWGTNQFANEHRISSDLIVEYNSVNNVTLPVIVDIFNVKDRIRREIGSSWACTNVGVCGNWVYAIKSNSGTGLRVGMEVNVELMGHPTWVQSLDKPIITAISPGHNGKYIATDSRIRDNAGTVLTNSVMGTDWTTHQYPAHVNFTSPRVLNFERENIITGVNIVDDMLFWTDDQTEPKKVNIKRGKEGSNDLGICNECDKHQNPANGTTHTELVVNEESIIGDDSLQKYLQEKHITVIKKSPLTPPKLEMYDSVSRFNPLDRRVNNIYGVDYWQRWHGIDPKNTDERILAPVGMTSIEWNGVNVNKPLSGIYPLPGVTSTGNPWSHDERIGYFHYGSGGINRADYRVDDVLLLTDNQDAAIDSVTGEKLDFDGDDVRIKLKVISSDSTATDPKLVNSPVNGNLEVKILYIDPTIEDKSAHWYVRLETSTQPLYELKFPKFGYRYKYEDGEYSAFSPFSEIAFLPKDWKDEEEGEESGYHPVKGYNRCMMNDLKQLFIKDFIPPNIPLDVVEIDILYKESDSPNIYTIRSFKDVDPEWNINGTGNYRGYFEIKDDLIHAVVASNQLLRPWDNVPRKALGQEVTGNRLIYGNYLQNYDLVASGGADPQQVKPEFKATIENYPLDTIGSPETSLKSMRTYQLGIIYKDIYGRETPVITHPSGVAKLDSAKSIFNNKFTVQALTPPPFWADSFKYFVKEVSNEYYNLAMDRWYYAGDRNVWLSFPSEDRNKVDDETTIILKKTNISDIGSELGGFVSETPRYKILAIKNEAPDFIKTVKTSFGKLDLETKVNDNDPTNLVSGGIGSVIANSIFPFKDFDQIQIERKPWEDSAFHSLQNSDNKSGYKNSETNRSSSFMVRILREKVGEQVQLSEWYDITNITWEGAKGDNTSGHYAIKIDGLFKDDVLFATSLSPSTSAASNSTTGIISDLFLEIGKKTMENKAQFDGRFFVKIESDDNIWKYIMGNATPYLSSTNALSVDGLASDAHVLTWRVIHSKQLFFNAYNCHYDVSSDTYIKSLIGASALNEEHIRQKDDWERLHLRQSDGHSGCPGAHVYGNYGCPKRSRWYIDLEPNWANHGGSGSPWTSHPGEGAQLGSNKLHISWSGIGSGLTSNGRDVGHYFPEEQPFIDMMEMKGRKFRFTNDPDNIVYTITDWSTHDCYNYQDPSKPNGWNSTYSNTMKRYRMTIDPPFGTGASTVLTDANNVDYTWQPTNPYTSIQYNDPINSGISGTVQSQLATNGYQPSNGTPNILGAADEGTSTGIEFVEPYYSNDNEMPVNPAIWETEPKEDVGLDIYYEIGQAYPVNMCSGTGELYIQQGATVSMHLSNKNGTHSQNGWTNENYWRDGALGPVVHPGGTPTTILSHRDTITSAATSFTHTGHQHRFFPGSSGMSNKIVLDIPFNNNIVPGILVSDSSGLIPGNTTVQSIFSYGILYKVIVLSTAIPHSLPWFTLTGPTMTLTFTGATPDPAITITPTVTNSITGCIGDASGSPAQLSTLVEFSNGQVLNSGDILSFSNPDGSIVTATVAFDSISNLSGTEGNSQIYLNALTHGERHTLPYYNCYTFGNGVESNRIRDLYNAVTVDKGVKASTTLAEQYHEEHRKSGLIFSGIYNSMNGVNRLNQFIMAENITKDLNPTYGSIQKLHTRDTDLVTLCEDKVLKVLSNKDALYNADDTKNITATSNVLGNAMPFVGDYGISKNPESFASEAFRSYFTDRERGAVLRLSRDGLTPISDAGMKDWFADNLNTVDKLIGSYDSRKSLYNITLKDYHLTSTVSFSERSRGWVSFKTINPEIGFSLNNDYYTANEGMLWRHHDDSVDRNSFYDREGFINSESSITVLFNDLPSVVKSFTTLNYEGSQSKIIRNTSDDKYYNNQAMLGWYVDSITTDQQTGTVAEFIDKEGKWFNYIVGEETVWQNSTGNLLSGTGNLDTHEFSTQGIGVVTNRPIIE